jgi:hypothetical protein
VWALAASFTLTFTVLALGLLGACYLVVRFVVMTAPVWAVIAVLPGRRRVLRKAVVLVGVSVLFGTGMAVLVPVHVLVTGDLLDPFVTDRRAERAPKKKEEDQERKGAPTGAPAGPGGDGPGGGGVGDGVGGGGPAGAGRSGPNPNPGPDGCAPDQHFTNWGLRPPYVAADFDDTVEIHFSADHVPITDSRDLQGGDE